MRDYNISYTIGWTEHDKLETFSDFFKVWNFFQDYPYERGNGDKTINYNYDVNAIFRII